MAAIGVGASLAVRQRRGAGFDFTGPALPRGVSLTRASAAACYDGQGVMVMCAADVARFDRDPASRAPRGLLVEAAATNLLAAPAAFDAAAWQKAWIGAASPTVAANAGLAADATVSADQIGLTSVTAADSLSVVAQSVSLTAGRYTFSVWLRGMSGGEQPFLMATPDGRAFESRPVRLSPQSSRYSLSFTADARTWYVQIGTDRRDAAQGATTAAQVQAWGAQLETGNAATSYAPAGRAAEVVTLDWASRGVADGAVVVRYTFDDGSSEDRAATVSGGRAVVPLTLARPRLIRAALA